MHSPVELIVGPARSGKAAYALAEYQEALASAGSQRCLMLVPTGLRQRATESLLLAAQPHGVLFQPNVLTLQGLADRLLAAGGRPVRRISELARRQVIRRCLDQLDSKSAEVLGQARTTPGLVDALDALFRELKAARIEPDAFGRALAGQMRTPRNRVLALLYDSYQKALQAAGVYDDAGQFWHAASLVAQGQFGPFGDLELLVADGFHDFAPAQLDVLEALSRRAKRTIITLLWAPDRPELFGVTGRTRERLRERFGSRLSEASYVSSSGLPSMLDHVRRHLFGESEVPPLPADATVSVIRAAGRVREMEEVARQAVDLVRAGADRPASIAIIARSLDAYADLARQVFAQYGLPVYVAADRPLADFPVVRAALALARLRVDDFAYRAVARVLKSNYFRPEAFGSDEATARAAVRLARDASVWKGSDSYFHGFSYLRSLLERQRGLLDDSGEPAVTAEHAAARAAEIDRAEALLRQLFDAVEHAVRPEASRRTFAEGLRWLIRTAGLWSAAAASPFDPGCAADLAALAALDEVLDEVAALEPDDTSVSLKQFLGELGQAIALRRVSEPGDQDTPVVVLDVWQCRSLAFDHVFVVGLAEKEFPRRGRHHPFFDDAERRDLRHCGIELADAGHDAEQEMILFYTAVTRARRSLVLSYSSLDAQGRPTLPSHYLEQLCSLIAGPDGRRTVAPTDVPARDLALPTQRARSRRELLAATMFSLWGPGRCDNINLNLAILDALLARGPAAETAITGLAAEWEREHGHAFGPFDGVLRDPGIVDDLSRRIPAQMTMSAGRLESFGTCPFTFFAKEILRLEPVEEPSPDLGPMEVGLIYHAVLERFFSALVASPDVGGRLTAETYATALTILQRTANEYFEHLQAAGRTGSAALWQVQKKNILADLERLLRWHVENQGPWRAAYTEVPFGAAAAATVQPPGRPQPIERPSPHGPVRIQGRIDRIDLPIYAPTGYQVIDYKTSTAPGLKDMSHGTSFQLPIYLWAAEAILDERHRRGQARAFFVRIRRPGHTRPLQRIATSGQPSSQFYRVLERADEYLRRFVDAMRRGQYPVWPRAGCPARCGYQEICRYAAWRIDRKRELNPLPNLEIIEDEDEAEEESP